MPLRYNAGLFLIATCLFQFSSRLLSSGASRGSSISLLGFSNATPFLYSPFLFHSRLDFAYPDLRRSHLLRFLIASLLYRSTTILFHSVAYRFLASRLLSIAALCSSWSHHVYAFPVLISAALFQNTSLVFLSFALLNYSGSVHFLTPHIQLRALLFRVMALLNHSAALLLSPIPLRDLSEPFRFASTLCFSRTIRFSTVPVLIISPRHRSLSTPFHTSQFPF